MKTIPAVLFTLCLVAGLPAFGQGLLSVVPNQGEAGASLEITINGEPDAIFSELCTVTFTPAGEKITHDQVTLEASNSLKTTIHIAADTTPGLQTVAVTNGAQVFAGADLFEVTAGSTQDPVIEAVSPDNATTGASLSVTVIGSNTNFASGSTLSFEPSGIQVGSVTVAGPTELQAQITVDTTASPGPRTVTVTSGSEVASGEDLFNVLLPAVILDPTAGTQGQTIPSLTITGGPGGYSAQTGVDLGIGVSVGQVAGTDTTLTLTDVSLEDNAPVGLHDLTLTAPDFNATAVFLVQQGPDTQLLSITPDHGDRGHPGLAVTLSGQNTHYDEPGLAVEFSASGISASELNGIDPITLEARLFISGQAAEGPVDVSVALGADVDCGNCEMTTLAGGFEITTPGTLDSADPPILEAGQTVDLAVTASDGQFADGQTVLLFEPPDGLEVLSLTVSDANHLTAELQLSAEAPGDPRDVTAVTGSEVALGPGLVDVYHPEIRQVVPSTAFPGTSPSVTIRGIDVPFDVNTQVEFSGTGISVGELTYDPQSPDEVMVAVTVAADAPLEARDVIVTTDYLQVTGVQMFEVVELKPKQESEGCSCSGTPFGASGLGLGLWGLLLFWRRRSRTRP